MLWSMQWLFDLWNGFVSWFLSWDWGDVPGWLSIVGALLIGLLAYFRRSRIFAWFRRATNAPPSFESQPSWEMVQEGKVCKVTNHGPGDAFDVRFDLTNLQYLGNVPRLLGRYNFDRINDGETVELRPRLPQNPSSSARADLRASWILRHDPDKEPERDWEMWRLRLTAWHDVQFEENEDDGMPF